MRAIGGDAQREHSVLWPGQRDLKSEYSESKTLVCEALAPTILRPPPTDAPGQGEETDHDLLQVMTCPLHEFCDTLLAQAIRHLPPPAALALRLKLGRVMVLPIYP